MSHGVNTFAEYLRFNSFLDYNSRISYVQQQYKDTIFVVTAENLTPEADRQRAQQFNLHLPEYHPYTKNKVPDIILNFDSVVKQSYSRDPQSSTYYFKLKNIESGSGLQIIGNAIAPPYPAIPSQHATSPPPPPAQSVHGMLSILTELDTAAVFESIWKDTPVSFICIPPFKYRGEPNEFNRCEVKVRVVSPKMPSKHHHVILNYKKDEEDTLLPDGPVGYLLVHGYLKGRRRIGEGDFEHIIEVIPELTMLLTSEDYLSNQVKALEETNNLDCSFDIHSNGTGQSSPQPYFTYQPPASNPPDNDPDEDADPDADPDAEPPSPRLGPSLDPDSPPSRSLSPPLSPSSTSDHDPLPTSQSSSQSYFYNY